MNQAEFKDSGWGQSPSTGLHIEVQAEDKGFMNKPSCWQSVMLQEDWQKHTTAPVASAQHGTFPSVLILSARASHMAKARVKVRKSAHGKVMSREGRKE